MPQRQPTCFIPHGGGPCFFMDWTPADLWKPMELYLRNLADRLPERPCAILLISAHWEEERFTVGSGAAPDLIYDYYGFPPHTYQLRYPAPGNPELARKVKALIEQAGLNGAEAPERGYDHGVFIPLLLVYPDASIPVVQLSLQRSYDPRLHLQLGQTLAPLRDVGVLIVGSGMSFHNMQAFRNAALLPQMQDEGLAFDAWLTDALTRHSGVERLEALAHWDQAPGARTAHPVRGEEHLLPLMVAAGAAGDDPGHHDFQDARLMVSGFRFG